jgi:hypothetical protein
MVLAVAITTAFSFGTTTQAQQLNAQYPAGGNFALVAHLSVDGVAEIVAATPDGETLLYTSADAGVLGVVDITNPARPVLLPRVDVRINGMGEPTSVAISPDGRFAVMGLRMDDDVTNARRGSLRVFDISNDNDGASWTRMLNVG